VTDVRVTNRLVNRQDVWATILGHLGNTLFVFEDTRMADHGKAWWQREAFVLGSILGGYIVPFPRIRYSNLFNKSCKLIIPHLYLAPMGEPIGIS